MVRAGSGIAPGVVPREGRCRDIEYQPLILGTVDGASLLRRPNDMCLARPGLGGGLSTASRLEGCRGRRQVPRGCAANLLLCSGEQAGGLVSCRKSQAEVPVTSHGSDAAGHVRESGRGGAAGAACDSKAGYTSRPVGSG